MQCHKTSYQRASYFRLNCGLAAGPSPANSDRAARAADKQASPPPDRLRFRGQRFDCGSKAGFLQATVAFGLAREELKDEFAEYLSDINSILKAAE